MTHDELRDRLLDLAYGELSPRDAREVEEHAASCEGCRAELARIRGTRALMSQLPAEPAPERGERILLAAAREAVRNSPLSTRGEGGVTRRVLPRWVWAAPIAAASLAAVVALSLRLGEVRPPSADREDPNALLGASPYARAPEPAQAPPAVPPAPPPGASAEAPRAAARAEQDRDERRQREERPRLAERKAAPAPAPATEPRQAFATPPSMADAAPAPAAPPPSAAPPSVAERSAPSPGLAGAMRAPAAGAPGSAEAKSDAAPPRRAAKAAAPQAAPRDEAASGGSAPGAVARYDELRRAGRLRADFRAFPACPREPWRRLERDPEGRVVSYAWEILAGARRLRLEVVYAPDGSVARARAVDAVTGAPDPSAGFEAPRAREIDLDAPTACER